MNIFEQASRIGLTVDSEMGQLSVTHLWTLALPKLDTIAVNLRRTLRDREEGSLIGAVVSDKDNVNLKFEIVKHIIEVRLAEAGEKTQAKIKSDQRQRIQEIITKKEGQALEDLPVDQLKAMLKD